MVFSATESLSEGPFADGFLKSPPLRQALFSFVALITMAIDRRFAALKGQ